MTIGLLILILSTLVSLFSGLFVLIRNPKQSINKIYSFTSLILILFSIVNYLSLNNGSSKLLFIRLVMMTTTVGVASIYILVYSLNTEFFWRSILNRVLLIISLIIAVLDITPFVFRGLSSGTYALPIPSIGAFFYLAQFLIILILTGYHLVQGIRKKQSITRKQNKTLLIGVIPILILAPITSFIFPIVLKNSNYIVLSPIYSTFFVCMVGYTIIKHGLFDIKLIIARALTYMMSIALVAMIYGMILLGAIKLIFHPHISLIAQVFLALSTALAALSFQRIKRMFDSLTSKYFYQDAYDVQAFLDSFNKILVTTFELDPLLRKVGDIIEQNLKPKYIVFGIKEINEKPIRIIGTKNSPEFNNSDIAFVRSVTPRMKTKCIVTDMLDEKYKALQDVMKEKEVAVLVRLATNTYEEGIGYLVLGPKKSGNIYSSQDIKVLEIIANELVVAIQNALHTEEIENFNITLQEKIKDATHKLRKTNDKLRALDEAKDDFVSMASHQLRTPLTSVKGNISLVLDGDAGKITTLQRQLLEQAFISSQRMVFLIADLLNVSRLKTGKFVIEPSEVDMVNVVEEEVNQLIDTAKSRHLTLEYQKPSKITPLILDETKTRQVIMNFIDNAIYYTPAGGTIKVVLSETPTAVECRVIDNGIGVPKHEQHHLFTKFYRAGNAQKARPDGTGLGLFMAKKVIIAEGGAIIFETEEGKGSTFGFSLPKDKLAVGVAQLPPQESKQPALVAK